MLFGRIICDVPIVVGSLIWFICQVSNYVITDLWTICANANVKTLAGISIEEAPVGHIMAVCAEHIVDRVDEVAPLFKVCNREPCEIRVGVDCLLHVYEEWIGWVGDDQFRVVLEHRSLELVHKDRKSVV